MLKYQILIPAYNAQGSIAELLDLINDLPEKPRQIVVVDDASTDKTAEIVGQIESVKILKNNKNCGKGYSLRVGFEDFLQNSELDYLLCMDADLQHPVTSISDFIKKAKTNSGKVLIGNRNKNVRQMPVFRVVSNTLSSKILTWLTKQNIRDSQCGFRLIHRDVLSQVSLRENGFQLESEFILEATRQGYTIEFVDIPTIYSREKSNIRHLNDTFRFLRLAIKEML